MPRSEKRKNIKVSKTRRCKGEGTEMGWKDNWQGFALGQWWSRWIPHTLGGSARNALGKRAAAQGSVGTWKDERGELVGWLRSHWGWRGEKCACVYEGRFNPSWGSLIWLVNGFPRAAVRKYTTLCLKTWKMYPLTVWRPGVQNEGVGRVGSSGILHPHDAGKLPLNERKWGIWTLNHRKPTLYVGLHPGSSL